jgi:antitoxin VapB
MYILRYIQAVTQRAKLFQNGGSQAVRLPQSCRFPEDATEVVIRREGNRIILEPVDEWSDDFRDLVGAWAEDIPRPVPATAPKRDPFK